MYGNSYMVQASFSLFRLKQSTTSSSTAIKLLIRSNHLLYSSSYLKFFLNWKLVWWSIIRCFTLSTSHFFTPHPINFRYKGCETKTQPVGQANQTLSWKLQRTAKILSGRAGHPLIGRWAIFCGQDTEPQIALGGCSINVWVCMHRHIVGHFQ